MVAKTKIKTPEKLLAQLTGAEAANRKHKARIAELEKETTEQAVVIANLAARIEKLARDAKAGSNIHQ